MLFRSLMGDIMNYKIGQRVKVKDQDIYGKIIRMHDITKEIVIQDEDSEYEPPDDELIYKLSEIEYV